MNAAAENMKPRLSREEFDRLEGERMWDAWSRPSVRAEMFGERDPKQERAAAAKQAEPAAREDDPYWSYVAAHG